MGDRGTWAQQVRRILVVSGHELTRSGLSRALSEAGIAPEAVDASDGSDVLERRFSDPSPDLLILDTGLPGQDPVGLVRAIRTREAEHGLRPVPIASVTDTLADEFRLQLIEAGTDLFLAEPISRLDVVAAARSLVTCVPRPLRRVLVVDDQERNVRMARLILEKAAPGIRTEGLTDPRAGLARCQAEPHIDLLIINGYMPGLEGCELIGELRAIEAREGSAPMAIIIESGASDCLDRALEAGADLACGLPWDSVELVVAVRALFPGAAMQLPFRREQHPGGPRTRS